MPKEIDMLCRCGHPLIQHEQTGHFVCKKCGQFTARKIVKTNQLIKLQKKAKKCNRCSLGKTRNKLVFGEGNLDARLMLIGEAPGQEENKSGIPFIGPAGKVLDRLLTGIGLTREEVYIANVLCCRPPDNRNPEPKEVKACKERLLEQIRIIDPSIVCTLGASAINSFLKKDKAISDIHGKVIHKKRTVFISYHPAYAVYDPNNYKILEEDFEKLGRLYRG